MTDRIPTGSPRLDEVLHGGLLKNAITLTTGVPGSGKTILAQQAVFTNATKERPALYLTAFAEPLDKILRWGETLSFFDPAAIRDGRVVYHDIGGQIGTDLDAVVQALDDLLRQTQPGLVVIDGMRSMHRLSAGDGPYRRFLYDLLRRLTATATTAILNAAYPRAEVLDQPEAAIADCVIALDAKQVGEREVRVLQVLKLRGSGYRSGEHLYRISSHGLDVFPRLAEPMVKTRYAMSETHTGTGIGALDELLAGGGYWSGATTLVAGPTGIGKTLMCLHFLYRGAELGEPGTLATFQENESQLDRVVRSFGWSVEDPNVHVMSRGVVDMNIDEWVYELLDVIEKTGTKRVVIDSLLDLASAAGDAVRFREWMFSFTQRVTRAGVSVMLTVEVPELFEVQRISDYGISHLSDNVILLQYAHQGATLARTLTVLKTRAMKHEPTVRRYTITSNGFELGEVLELTR